MANSGFATSDVAQIYVDAGAELTGSGVVNTLGPGTLIEVFDDGEFLSSSTVNNFVAPSADVTIGGDFNFRLGTLNDDATGIAGVDWSRLNVTGASPMNPGSVFFDTTSMLVLNFSTGNNPDSGDPFWLSNHTWQIVEGENLSGTMGILSPTYAAGTFSFDSGTGLLSFAAIPEPSTALLMMLGGAGWMLLRRRRVAPSQRC